LANDLVFLSTKQVVQLASAAFPFGLMGRGQAGVLGEYARDRLFGLGARNHLRTPVDNQQKQDQRSHGAKQHRQERKC
jgi:hypothetical protein